MYLLTQLTQRNRIMLNKTKILFVFIIALCIVAKSQVQYPGIPLSNTHLVQAKISTIKMASVNVDKLLMEDEQQASIDKTHRFGYPFNVNYGITNAGTWNHLADGSKIWRLSIESEGAVSINLIFDKFFLPAGSALFVYNEDKSMIIGAFTDKSNRPEKVFSTAPVRGDKIFIEYNQPPGVSSLPELNISYVVHAYRDIYHISQNHPDSYGDAGSCQINVNCSVGQPWQLQSRSVAMTLKSNNSRWCTGALINNTRYDATPYFLTANHCWEASQPTWIFMFNYQSPNCNNSDGPTTYTISGSTLKAKNWDSDFCLVQLTSAPPESYNVYYSGWNRIDIAAISGVSIHHPKNDIKKISFYNTALSSSSYSSGSQYWPENSHWLVWWSTVEGKTAVTEGGSSGSPLFDQNHRIVGQLHGGDSYCGAAASSLWDTYGKLSMSWEGGGTPSTRLKDWLDPDNTGLSYIDGLDPTIPMQITVNQKLSNEQNIGTIGRWNGTSFNPPLEPGQPISASIGSSEVLQSDQAMYSNEKYNSWFVNTAKEVDVTNHHTFQIKTTTTTLSSYFYPTHSGVTIKSNLVEATSVEGAEIDFKDPWLIDLAENGVKRNQGMSAPFKTRISPFYPNYTTPYGTDIYQGVFLGQTFGGSTPYYTIRAPLIQSLYLSQTGLTHKLYLQNWSATGATLGHATAGDIWLYGPSYRDENAVVFTSGSAIISANYKGTQLSDIQTAYRNNSQRKTLKDNSGRLFLTYESMGNVFLEKSTDNGATWEIENYGKPMNTRPAKSPSLSTCKAAVLLTYQEQSTTSGYSDVKVVNINYSNNQLFRTVIGSFSVVNPTDLDLNPITSFYYDIIVGLPKSTVSLTDYRAVNRITTGWEESGNLILRCGQISGLGNSPFISWGSSPYTITNAKHAAASSFNQNHIVWEHVNSATSIDIHFMQYDVMYTPSGDNYILPNITSIISTGSGYTKNYSPSVTSLADDARVCWIGYRENEDEEAKALEKNAKPSAPPGAEYRVVFRAPSYYHFWHFGSMIASPTIARDDYASLYIIGWSENNGQYNKWVFSQLSG